MHTFLLLAAVLTATSCKPAYQEQASAAKHVQATRNYVAEVENMPQRLRDATFFHAIRDAGLSCQKIIDSRPIPATSGQSTNWRVQCEDKAYHLINIRPDGSAVVISRIKP